MIGLALLVAAQLVRTCSVDLVPDGTNDVAPMVRDAIDHVRAAGGGEVRFARGEYHFRTSVPMDFYVSNHDNPRPRGVFVPVTNVTDVALVGDGAEFILHGEGIALALVDAKRVRVKGIGVDWASPYYTETRLVRLEEGRPVVRTGQRDFALGVEEGKVVSLSEGWKRKPRLAGIFAGDTREFLGFIWFSGCVSELGRGVFRLEDDWRKTKTLRPLRADDLVLLRDPYRPNPAILLYRTAEALLEDCVVHSSAGMGVIAQRSENVTVRGSGRAADGTAGSFARKGAGRFTSSQADATHFSNCRGQVTVENCLFEGMCDDAINVHSTCLRIEQVTSAQKLLCRYMHRQSVGFEVFLPGERLRCIRGRTLETSESTVCVAAVERLAEDRVALTLAAPLPDGFGVGDAVENADWQPSVRFANNIVRLSVPRATLFTTPGKVVCESNLFDRVSGQAVHMSADAWDWYESGACRDVVIRDNVFRRCMLNSGRGVIQIEPNVKHPEEQRTRYHRNVVIAHNVFDQHRGPLLYARSASNLVWRANAVLGADGWDVRDCDDVKIEKASAEPVLIDNRMIADGNRNVRGWTFNAVEGYKPYGDVTTVMLDGLPGVRLVSKGKMTTIYHATAVPVKAGEKLVLKAKMRGTGAGSLGGFLYGAHWAWKGAVGTMHASRAPLQNAPVEIVERIVVPEGVVSMRPSLSTRNGDTIEFFDLRIEKESE